MHLPDRFWTVWEFPRRQYLWYFGMTSIVPVLTFHFPIAGDETCAVRIREAQPRAEIRPGDERAVRAPLLPVPEGFEPRVCAARGG